MGTKKSLITADCPRCGKKHTKMRLNNYGHPLSISCPKCRFTVWEDVETPDIDALIKKWNHTPKMEGFLSEEELHSHGAKKTYELFGEVFVEKYINCQCISYGYGENSYSYFTGFHVEDNSYPRKGPKYKGWPFWLQLNIDYFTGESTIMHCCLPDGRRIMIDLMPYQELHSGEKSIHDAIDKTQVVPDKVITYLRCGEPYMMAPGMYEHPFKKDVTLLGPYWYTDGIHCWDRDTWKYVLKYGVVLPQEFIDYVMSGAGTQFIDKRISECDTWSDVIKSWKEQNGMGCYLPSDAGDIELKDF